ncbi:hypothetical protein VaNZ11_014017 [Volvox africanus]|uniref:Pseudouridine synthase I TruA alpha/beta domain-containing protein n=1 Tax=Volvox africanus TaxID=51714 RepID=A0ABQ5SJP3_9CHLO|nr:hypothetical protein VaNZ11_014017 [Volvox africanus]
MLHRTAGPLSAAPRAHRVAASNLPVIAGFIYQTSFCHLASSLVIRSPSISTRYRYSRSPFPQLNGIHDSRPGRLRTLRNVTHWRVTLAISAPSPHRILLLSKGCQRGFSAAAAESAMVTSKAEPETAACSQATASRILAVSVSSGTDTSDAVPVDASPQPSQSAISPSGREAAKAAAEAAYAASGGALRTKRPPGMVKRSIAMHLGYVGTAFKGLQVNRLGAPDDTVEEVLERAVFGAGLIVESNFGDLKKIKWTRNSRTDKGVHSVATVVGLRVLLPGDERFDTDPEGLEIASTLNARLPPQVRVFSAQRVQKKFNSRRFCFDRTYEYFLPAYLLLGPHGGAAPVAAGNVDAASTAAEVDTETEKMQEGHHLHHQHHHQHLQGCMRPQQLQWDEDLEAARAALVKLREALSCYVGTHPFHNYTAKRKTYVDTAKDREARKAAREAVIASAGDVVDCADGTAGCTPVAVEVDTDEDEVRLAAEAAAETAVAAPDDDAGAPGDELDMDRRYTARKPVDDDDDARNFPPKQQRPRPQATKKEDEPLEEDDEEGETDGAESVDGEDEGTDVGGTSPRRRWVQSCRWLYEKSEDKRDRVTVRHFRTITSFTADDPAPLVPGGVPCVRLRVRGMSFMLHQIRHMIGGALAVARGSLPLQLLRASLAGHARVTVPRAPPHTLILADCTFPPFRKAGADEARVHRWSGERLQLRTGGQSNLTDFRRQSLDLALNELLHHPDWERFEMCLPKFYWDPQAQEEVIRAYATWEATREERAKQREAAAAEAAALAAAATAADRLGPEAAANVPEAEVQDLSVAPATAEVMPTAAAPDAV